MRYISKPAKQDQTRKGERQDRDVCTQGATTIRLGEGTEEDNEV